MMPSVRNTPIVQSAPAATRSVPYWIAGSSLVPLPHFSLRGPAMAARPHSASSNSPIGSTLLPSGLTAQYSAATLPERVMEVRVAPSLRATACM